MCHRNQTVSIPLYSVDSRINWKMRVYPCNIDACIASLIFKMNHKQNIQTNTSCCGHGEHYGYIGIDVKSVYNAIKVGYHVIKEARIWNREDGAELEDWDYWIPITQQSNKLVN